MNEKEFPFRVNPEQYDSLRLEVQGISPELQTKLDEVTRAICEKFIKHFGKYLNSRQKKALRSVAVLAVDNENLEHFEELWADKDSDIQVDPLNGFEYEFYTGSKKKPTAIAGMQTWDGRLPIVAPNKSQAVDVKNLIFEEEFEKSLPERDIRNIKEIIGRRHAFYNTLTWARDASHEKIHSILDTRLPLPICECAAYGYQYLTFVKSGLDAREDHYIEAKEYWSKLLDQIGPDLNLYAFGNLNN